MFFCFDKPEAAASVKALCGGTRTEDVQTNHFSLLRPCGLNDGFHDHPAVAFPLKVRIHGERVGRECLVRPSGCLPCAACFYLP